MWIYSFFVVFITNLSVCMGVEETKEEIYKQEMFVTLYMLNMIKTAVKKNHLFPFLQKN